MDVQTNEILSIVFKLILALLTIAFGFFRWVIGRIQGISDRISKIEGTCQEREKTVYKEEKTDQAEED